MKKHPTTRLVLLVASVLVLGLQLTLASALGETGITPEAGTWCGFSSPKQLSYEQSAIPSTEPARYLDCGYDHAHFFEHNLSELVSSGTTQAQWQIDSPHVKDFYVDGQLWLHQQYLTQQRKFQASDRPDENIEGTFIRTWFAEVKITTDDSPKVLHKEPTTAYVYLFRTTS